MAEIANYQIDQRESRKSCQCSARRRSFYFASFVGFLLIWSHSIQTTKASIPLFSGKNAGSHSYDRGERVPVYGVQVGPILNPFEKYDYFSLPFCVPSVSSTTGAAAASSGSSKAIKYESGGIYDMIMGTRRVDLGLDIRYGIGSPVREICSVDTSVKPVYESFLHALHSNFWTELIVDDLPIYSLIGVLHNGTAPWNQNKKHPPTFLIYTHMHFVGEMNDGHIVGFRLEMKEPKPLENRGSLTFTYDVTWLSSSREFTRRFEIYLDLPFFSNRSHIFALVNAFVIGFVLIGMVATLLVRALRGEREAFNEALMEDMDENLLPSSAAALSAKKGRTTSAGGMLESGWRALHGDVFRTPPAVEYLSAAIGTGVQLVFVSIVSIVTALTGSLYSSPSLLSAVVFFLVIISSFVSGYYSGGMYRRSGQSRWLRTMGLSVSFIPGVVLVFSVIVPNMSRWLFRTSPSLWTYNNIEILVPLILLVFVFIPLHVFGTLVGRGFRGVSMNPCATNPLPRPIEHEKLKWWNSPAFLIPVGGMFPFGVVFVEVYYLIISFWNYKFYFVFDFALAVLIMLIVVTSCSAIVVTYVLLQSEDYRWPWVAYLTGAWSGMYVFLYSCYTFFSHQYAGGRLTILPKDAQEFHKLMFAYSIYVSHSAAICILFSVMTGAIAYISASVFVRVLYRNTKHM